MQSITNNRDQPCDPKPYANAGCPKFQSDTVQWANSLYYNRTVLLDTVARDFDFDQQADVEEVYHSLVEKEVGPFSKTDHRLALSQQSAKLWDFLKKKDDLHAEAGPPRLSSYGVGSQNTQCDDEGNGEGGPDVPEVAGVEAGLVEPPPDTSKEVANGAGVTSAPAKRPRKNKAPVRR